MFVEYNIRDNVDKITDVCRFTKKVQRMKVNERRKSIAALLMASDVAISGGELSERFGVSRQIIVQDISALREKDYEIISTHHGYVIKKSPLIERAFKVRHTTDDTGDELNTIIELGGVVADVFVWHKVYGKIAAPLNIISKAQVEKFIEEVRAGKSTELMNITSGYHYHTVRAESEEILDKIELELAGKGYLSPEI